MGRKQQRQRTAASPSAPAAPPPPPATRGGDVLRGAIIGAGSGVVVCLLFVAVVMAALAIGGGQQLRTRALGADLYLMVMVVVAAGALVGAALGLARPHLHDRRVAAAMRVGVGALGYGTLVGLIRWAQARPLFTWDHLLMAVVLGAFLTPPLTRHAKAPEPKPSGRRR